MMQIDSSFRKDKNSYVLNVKFKKLSKPRDNLGNVIKTRFIDRRPFKLTKLKTKQKKILESFLDALNS